MRPSLNWIRSTYCADTNCVEVACLDGDVLMRDSKDPKRPFLRFSRADWDRFRAAVIADEFCFD